MAYKKFMLSRFILTTSTLPSYHSKCFNMFTGSFNYNPNNSNFIGNIH